MLNKLGYSKMYHPEDDIIRPPRGDNIIRTNDSNFVPNPNGLGHELFIKMKDNPDRIAQIDAETGVKETRETVLERSIRIACHLNKLGITCDDVISPCTTNHLNSSTVFFATLFTGAKVASMDPFAPDEDKIRQIELVKPKYLFTISETADSLADMVRDLKLETKIVVFGKTNKYISFDDFLIPLPEEELKFTPHTVTNLSEIALIIFSSGSTGTPKGVCYSHYSMQVIMGNGFCCPSIHLSYASLVWASAITITFHTATLGHIRLCASGFEPKKTWVYLKEYDVNVFTLAPQDLIAMLKFGRPKGLELPHLRMVYPAGGSLTIKSILKAREIFKDSKLMTFYGQTELGFCLVFDPTTEKGLEYYNNKPTMCGQPMAGATYKIVDPETEKVIGPNQPGELRIKTKTSMMGYYNLDSGDSFDKDGFLKTGDILYYDEDYCFFFVERLKEMLRYKMTAIAPTELEGILIQHPCVKIAVVIGIPTDEGDLATAVIVKNGDDVTAEELEDLVASKVDDRKRLRGGIYFLKAEEIPFTPSGKVRRRALKEYVLAFANQHT